MESTSVLLKDMFPIFSGVGSRKYQKWLGKRFVIPRRDLDLEATKTTVLVHWADPLFGLPFFRSPAKSREL